MAVAVASRFTTQQSNASNNIYNSYIARNVRYAILMSKCQSGKTGAYHALISLMLRMGSIDRAYVLCGSHETDLRDQAIEDAKDYHDIAMYETKTVQVLFRQDFDAAHMDIRRALIVVDESHLDQGKGQKLDRFLGRHGITMDGNPTNLVTNNTYILSVDATPYSELAALEHKETPYIKHVEELLPGDGYIGIDHYNYTGRLNPTFDLTTADGARRFGALIRGLGNKYALMRLSAAYKTRLNAQEVSARNICRANGYRVLEFTAGRTEINITRPTEPTDLPCLEDAPTRPTIVIIRGRLRAGKVVPKKHIGFVWEGAKTSKTDALVQGLPGRMCGYCQIAGEPENPKKLDTEHLPLLFVPESALERHETKVVKESEIERTFLTPHLLPTKATNLKASRLAADATGGRTQCTPIRLRNLTHRDEWDAIREDHGNDDGTKRECLRILRANLDLIRESRYLSDDQKDEIITRLASITKEQTHIRNLRGESQVPYYKELKAAQENGTTPAEHISDCPYMTFVVIRDGYRVDGEPVDPSYFYVVMYTDAGAGMEWIRSSHFKSRVPETNGKSIFSISNAALAAPLVAAGAIGFCEANIITPATFEAALREYITTWRSSHLTMSREISSVGASFAMNKAAFRYVSPRVNAVEEICRRVGREFHLDIRTTYARSSAGRGGHFNLRKISW